MSNGKCVSYRNKKILAFAKGQPCQHCGKNDGTTVAAHEGGLKSGRGTRLKAPDNRVAYLCWGCHYDYDNHLKDFVGDNRDFYFYKAVFKTQELWLNKLLPTK
jgi:hypothetical protein